MKPTDNPTTKTEARMFVLIWMIFFAAIGALAWWAPGVLLGAAAFTFVMGCVSIALNAELPRRRQSVTLIFPAGLTAAWALTLLSPAVCTALLLIAAATGAGAMLHSVSLAANIRSSWMDAGAPIGWTISAALLALVFYLVITPIALIRRLGGSDPLDRRFHAESTYWIARDQRYDRRRNYRQY